MEFLTGRFAVDFNTQIDIGLTGQTISFHYNSRKDIGVWYEMSRQGCWNFENLTALSDKWQTLFAHI